MYVEERQQEILRRARAEGRVDVMSLVKGLSVTSETIRRDLTALERAGVLRRVHGGAIPVERLGFELALATRDAVRTAEKERIAKVALVELPEEGAIIIDAGSTTERLAAALPMDRELTVVVNAPPLAVSLATRPNLTVIMLGGRVRRRTLATVDDWNLQMLSRIHVDVAFMGTNGLSAQCGFTTPDTAESAVKRSMIAAARRAVVLADHTKIGNNYFARFAEISEIDTLITDSGLDDELVSDFQQVGLRVICA